MTRVGVALCTYEGATYLREQLDSILAQSRLPDEVVIADDGSADATVEIARAWSLEAIAAGIEVTLIDEPGPGGTAANFARALHASTADVIALSDQDDVWAPDRIASALPAFDDEAVLLHHSDARLVDAAGAPHHATLADAVGIPQSWPEPTGGAYRTLVRRNLVTGATAMVRRELLALAGEFPRAWVHDEWLAITAAAHGRIAYSPTPLIDYRQHGSNQIGVEVPSLSYKWRRMREPRGDRHEVLHARATALVARLRETEAPAAAVQLATAKARFEERRAAWPRSRSVRWLWVWRECMRGTYPRLSSQGWMDVVRDCVQPAA